MRNGPLDRRIIVSLRFREHANPHEGIKCPISIANNDAQTASAILLPLAMATLAVANNHPVMHEALHVLIRDVRNIRQPL
ncbi:hypothetical protein [Bradyrhizobium sp. Gha]|uniref:hypothetical protein n=1 Tax=Bradyrhizobium sp. Gha TaxID=1855318 RepID=UPI000B897724|nr:hypothetical protein [Bradyrhizobium sp. Gha]